MEKMELSEALKANASVLEELPWLSQYMEVIVALLYHLKRP